MNEISSTYIPTDSQDSSLVVTLTVAQLKELVRQEARAAFTKAEPNDRLLSVEEAAKMLDVSIDWLYRHSKKLPFTRKVGPKMLRFSSHGIGQWIASRKMAS
jgi:predicted DNA-binding transcriptional regulator AlpA